MNLYFTISWPIVTQILKTDTVKKRRKFSIRMVSKRDTNPHARQTPDKRKGKRRTTKKRKKLRNKSI